MNKTVVNVIVVIFLVLMSIFLKKMVNINVNCTDYMHKKC